MLITIAAIGRLCHEAMRKDGAFERLALASGDVSCLASLPSIGSLIRQLRHDAHG